MTTDQFKKILDQLFENVDDQLGMDTVEGNEVFILVTEALFEVAMKYQRIRKETRRVLREDLQ